jgi:excinuclease ABC subunit C
MVGEKTVRKLLKHFGSSELVRRATEDELAALVGRALARRVRSFYDQEPDAPGKPSGLVQIT